MKSAGTFVRGGGGIQVGAWMPSVLLSASVAMANIVLPSFQCDEDDVPSMSLVVGGRSMKTACVAQRNNNPPIRGTS